MSKVFIISDSHFPFHNKSAFKEVMRLIKKERPTHVVHIGDLLDQYVFSKYTRSAKITPKDDIKLGIMVACQMWGSIQGALPRVKCIQVIGNHDVRLIKRVSERLPELNEVIDLMGMYKYPKVTVLGSYRDHIEIDGVIYTHGWLSKSIDHARHFGKPVVHGHLHRPGIATQGDLWAMDVGHIADERSLPMSYTQSKTTNWRMACGIVEDGKPRLILL